MHSCGAQEYTGNLVHGIRFCRGASSPRVWCCGDLANLSVLPLVCQLLGAPVTKDHLDQHALRLPFLDTCEWEFNRIEMQGVVVGVGRVVVSPGITTRRLA